MNVSRIIVALDNLTLDEAELVTEQLIELPGIWGVKVNDLLAYGYQVIDRLRDAGAKNVMADPKWHDIPKTVTNYAEAMSNHYPDIVTVHASGGVAMIKAATDQLVNTMVCGITVLTSLKADDCLATYGEFPTETVIRLAKMTAAGGARAVVCSALELTLLTALRGEGLPLEGMQFITPGIRLTESIVADDDQQRIATPAGAIQAGADLLVIGRPITKAPDVREAVRRITEEIDAVAAQR